MELEFTKIHAQGNDYIYFDFTDRKYPDIKFRKIARKYSRFHFGIGADGIVLLLKHSEYDAEMKIFNSDGSEAEMCGSALRSVVYLLHKKKSKKKYEIMTKSGKKNGSFFNGRIEVNLGKVKLIKNQKITIGKFTGYYTDIGNPHFVILDKTPAKMENFGQLIEHHRFFKNRTNVEWVQIVNRKKIKVDVWERGSGRTLACGTGSGAAAFVCKHLNLIDKETEVILPGGSVKISFENDNAYLSGEVEEVFKGSFEYNE